jgi:pyrophosphatase PpaX
MLVITDFTRPAAIVFDLDGTLADTFDHMVECFVVALEPRLGRRLSAAEIIAQFGPGSGTERIIIDYFAGGDDPESLERYYACYAADHNRVQLFPGIADALTICHDAGIPLGLMTGKGRATTEITLAKLGIRERFAVIVTGDEATRPKPDPMGPLLTLAGLRVAPASAIFVGDTRSDALGSRAAGMRAILAAWNNPADATYVAATYHPDAVFHTGVAFAAWLRELLGATEDTATGARYVG